PARRGAAAPPTARCPARALRAGERPRAFSFSPWTPGVSPIASRPGRVGPDPMNLRSHFRLVLPVALLLLSGCAIELQHDLSEQDANDIYVLLNENGISATKTRQEGGQEPMFLISVGKGDATQAAKLLREHALPRPHKEGLGIFQRIKGMVPTQSEERGILLEALGGEVANVFNSVDGVLMAEAIVSLPQITDL